MTQRTLFAMAALLLLLYATGCSLAETKQEIPSPVSHYPAKPADSASPVLQGRLITIATGDISGVYFPIGQALASIYEQSSSAVAGTRITKASIENTQLVAQKKAELGFSTTDALLLVNQQSNAEAKQQQSHLRAITGLYSNYIHIVATQKAAFAR